MKELKTLKDMKGLVILRVKGKDYPAVLIDELKAEAVKWVKFYEKDGDFIRTKADWIKHFFNLTGDKK